MSSSTTGTRAPRAVTRPWLAILWLALAATTIILISDDWRTRAAALVAWIGGVVTTLLWADSAAWRARRK